MIKTRRIRICFVVYYAYPLFNPKVDVTYGGAEVQMYQIAKELSKNPIYDICFIVGDFGQENIEVYDDIKVIKQRKINQKSIKYLNGALHCFSSFKALVKVDASIYIQQAAGAITGIIGLYCKLYKKKFIYFIASKIDTNKGYKKIHKLNGMLYEYGLKHSNVVIAQNKNDASLLKKNYKKNSIVIKNPFKIPIKKFKLNIKKHLLWVASAQSLKRPELFLHLAACFPYEKFLMIMPKKDYKLWKAIKKQALKISNLEFIEKIPLTEINKYFKKAKIFINTSIYEGFPNTFVQATMNSTPIVSLNVNPDNFLNKYQCGYFAKNSMKKMQFYIKKLLVNQKDWEKKSKNSYIYAKKNHDINLITQEINKVLLNYNPQMTTTNL